MKSIRSPKVWSAATTESGDEVVRDHSIQVYVLRSKIKKAVESAAQDFKLEWAKSVGDPMSLISESFATLTLNAKNVLLWDRVPPEKLRHYMMG